MKNPTLQSVEEIHKEIAPLVDKMRAKYPQDLEGLEPALTSDIAEIVYQDRTTLRATLLDALEEANDVDEAKVIISEICV